MPERGAIKMPKRGRSIQLFLMDGESSGRIKCTLANWTGVAYKIPRTDLDKCKDRDHLKQSGVYFLFGTSDATGKAAVYVGQAGLRKNGEGILKRLSEHRSSADKDYWTEAVAFTTRDDSLGPTEISYLENRFYHLAEDANRYEVKNGNDPNHGNINEEKESELEEFIDNARVIMGVLGHNVFEAVGKKASSDMVPDTGNQELFLKRDVKNVGTIEASGLQTSEGFVVLKGSHISPVNDENIPSAIKERRKNASVDAEGVLLKDELFSSPSYAAIFATGKSENGLIRWKTAEGKTLKDLESEEGIVGEILTVGG